MRLAVVMYGGVSLAIYMYGVAEELWRLVRATAPNRPDHADEPADSLAYPEAESTEAIYRELGRLLPHDGSAAASGPVRTRFVVDVISGTSAGGINGVCLAKALANGSSLTALREVWVKEGDIGVLIDDEQSTFVEDEPGKRRFVEELGREGPPRSLLNGRRMLMRLLDALESMNPDGNKFASPLVEELDLFVTATDLEGRDTPLQLARGVVYEKRHAHRSHFRYAPREQRSDFAAEDSPFLAYAARCTSAFPFAFEPMVLQTLRQQLQPTWERFYPNYSDAQPPFPERKFSDGGILDNKPFSYAVATIGRREASLPVQRKLIFIEPDPAEPGRVSGKAWNAIETAQAAKLAIPTVETIREDVERILAHNRTVARFRDIGSRVHQDAEAQGKLAALTQEVPNEAWAAQTLDQSIAGSVGDGGQTAWGPSYGTYQRMKVRGLVDWLSSILVRAATGFDQSSDEAFAVAYLVRAWKESLYEESATDDRRSDNAFLIEFDIPYRARRLSFVLQKLRDVTSTDEGLVARTLAATPLEARSLPEAEDSVEIARTFRSGIHRVRRLLLDVEGGLSAEDGPLSRIDTALQLNSRDLKAILDASGDERMLAIATGLLQAARGDAFERLANLVREICQETAGRARVDIDKLLGAHTATRAVPDESGLQALLQYLLRFYYDAFEAYDLVLYPLQYGATLGEGNPVEIVRISPLEAERPDVPDAARKLRSISLGHFGGFLDEGWRRNDIAWGRLNAAEGLIRALLPDGRDAATANDLVERAHQCILEEYQQELSSLDKRDKDWPWHRTAGSPEEVPTRAALNRAAGVIGPLVAAILDEQGSVDRALAEEVAERRGGLTARAAKRGRVARFAWTLVRRTLDPERSGPLAALNVLRAFVTLPLVALMGVVGFIAFVFLASDAIPDRAVYWLLVLVGTIVVLVASALVGGVLFTRRAVASRLDKLLGFAPALRPDHDPESGRRVSNS